ncbi:hypothetical protein [Streptomyces sp. NPDC048111]|uniref:hypothetical protein n=1 Tax=Streptomyces sp. NPDC048111 TaxID=3365500 RepID=UPI0037218390
MAPGIRSLTSAVSLTGALLLMPLPYAVAVGPPSPGPSTTALLSPSVRPSVQPSPQALVDDQRLAGSRAGVGRTRPGRVESTEDLLPDVSDAMAPDEPAPAREAADPPAAQRPPHEPERPSSAPTPAERPPSARHRQRSQALSTSDDLRFHVLSLGAGLALTGLGLGFLGLRLRRP